MHLHFLTLYRQTLALHEALAGKTVTGCFTRHRNECVLSLSTPGEEPGYVQLSNHPQFPYVLLVGQHRRQPNSAALFPALTGKTIQAVSILQGERIIDIDFAGEELRMVLQFFTNRSNFLLVDREEQIVDAFKNARKLIGSRYEINSSPRPDPLQESIPALLEYLRLPQGGYSLDGLKNLQHANATVRQEVAFRAGIGTAGEELDRQQAEAVLQHLQILLQACRVDKAHIYSDRDVPRVFALTALQSQSARTCDVYEDLNSALRTFGFRAANGVQLDQQRRRFAQVLQRRISSLEKSLAQLHGRRVDKARAQQFRRIGQLLSSQPRQLRRDEKEIVLIDYFDPQMTELTIAVNPELSLQANAENYFRRARDYEQEADSHESEKVRLAEELQLLHGLQEQASQLDNLKAAEKLGAVLAENYLLQSGGEGSGAAVSLPYKRYMHKDAEIWVGKNARSNDELTFKYAARQDFWLHVQGYSGSHVVLRNPQRRDHPDGAALEYAARLAVTNSAARHASYVPVIYTQIRHVRKPRKAPPGTVIPAQVKSIYVDPL